jgi:coniferyl-aldehyde dehydrogenase
VASSRVYVQEGMYDELVKKLVEKTKAWVVGDPFDPKLQQGPQVDKKQFEKNSFLCVYVCVFSQY